MTLLSFDEALDHNPFITRSSWGLESMYFRNRKSRFLAIVYGASALSKAQVRSSLICFVFGRLITVFALVGLLVWLNAPVIAIIVIVFLYALLVLRSVTFVKNNNALYKEILTENDGSINTNQNSQAIYLVYETRRITEPTRLLSMIVLGIQTALFYIIPATIFFIYGNYRIGIAFILAGIIPMLRNVLNTPSVLRELGSLEGLERNNDPNIDEGNKSVWREKHRLNHIVSEISVGRRSSFWIGVFLFFCFAFCAIVFLAYANG